VTASTSPTPRTRSASAAPITIKLVPKRKRRRATGILFIALTTQARQVFQDRLQQRGQTKRRHSWQNRKLAMKASVACSLARVSASRRTAENLEPRLP
jgi:FPC/CPF motif-containing protein YcgG